MLRERFGGPRAEALELPIPPGFAVDAAAWRHGDRDVQASLAHAVARLERRMGRRFGGEHWPPLLLTVSSAADPCEIAVANVGLTAGVASSLGRMGSRAAASEARECLRRGYARTARSDLPGDAGAQLAGAIDGALGAGAADAGVRRRVHVRAMPLGVLDERSGVGRAFSRDPVSGAPGLYGFFAPGAPTPGGRSTAREPIAEAARRIREPFEELERVLPMLEAILSDLCAVDFTVERGRLWITGVRTPPWAGVAAIRVAVDLVDAGIIDVPTALERLPLSSLTAAHAPVLARTQDLDVLVTGTPAAPGAAVGTAVFDPARARALAGAGGRVVLVSADCRITTDPGFPGVEALVLLEGAPADAAARLARRLGRPAICADLDVEPGARVARTPDGGRLAEGEPVTVDGWEGRLVRGHAQLVAPQPSARVARLLSWCEERRRVPVLPEVPDGAVVVDVAPGELGDLRRTLARIGPAALVLRAPASGDDVRPPPAEWVAVVAPRELAWAASLLAARLPRLAAP